MAHENIALRTASARLAMIGPPLVFCAAVRFEPVFLAPVALRAIAPCSLATSLRVNDTAFREPMAGKM